MNKYRGEVNLSNNFLRSPLIFPQPPPPATFAIAVFDPVPGTEQRPIEIRDPNFSNLSSKFDAPVIQDSPGMMSIVNLETLVVIYKNTAMGAISDVDVQKLQHEISKTTIFIWRQSNLRLRLNVTYLIIDDYKDITEFTQTLYDTYWLYPDDGDNDDQSVEKDLIDHGVQPNQYDSINIFWAHNGSSGPLYGGLGGLHNWSSLGLTGITMNPIAWWFYSFEGSTAFSHEIQHTIDFMFEMTGYPDYFHADQPWYLPGEFGEDWDFWRFGMQACCTENWFTLTSMWGTIITVPDADGDGIPDIYLDEFPTEPILGSSVIYRDSDNDHLEDIDEVIAGIHCMASPTSIDSDADGLIDGDDPYPLYGVQTQIVRRSLALDGNHARWDTFTTQIFEQNAPLSATVSANWNSDFLYLMVIVDRYAGIHIQIDADNDGWFHGKDNYEISADPSYSYPTHPYIIGLARIWDSSDAMIEINGVPMWDNDPSYPGVRLITENDINRYARAYGSGYLIQLAIPRDSTTGMNLDAGEEIGLLVTFDYLDREACTYALLFEEDAWVRLILLNSRDETPPISQMGTLPAATATEAFAVNWSGQDFGSGIQAFDIQYRDGEDGQWINWLMQRTSLTAAFLGKRGYTYYFRTRAWDRAGNVEAYSLGYGDTWTLIPYMLYLPTTFK